MNLKKIRDLAKDWRSVLRYALVDYPKYFYEGVPEPFRWLNIVIFLPAAFSLLIYDVAFWLASLLTGHLFGFGNAISRGVALCALSYFLIVFSYAMAPRAKNIIAKLYLVSYCISVFFIVYDAFVCQCFKFFRNIYPLEDALGVVGIVASVICSLSALRIMNRPSPLSEEGLD